jgi:hypothetical protein
MSYEYYASIINQFKPLVVASNIIGGGEAHRCRITNSRSDPSSNGSLFNDMIPRGISYEYYVSIIKQCKPLVVASNDAGGKIDVANATRLTPRSDSLFKDMIPRGMSYEYYASIINQCKKLSWLLAILLMLVSEEIDVE